MRTAFFKHALGATLMAASLGIAVAPASALAGGASGDAGGSGSAGSPGASAGSGNAGGSGSAEGSDASGGSASSGGTTPTPGSHPGRRTIATWYGPGFYGHTTACGQKLTRKLVGVASRTLPCGTLVQISYRGRKLTAPVLDRGPFGDGATWDLTAGAAHALEITETVRIATQIVGSLPNTPALGEPLPATTPAPGATSGAPGNAPAEEPAAAAAAATGGASAH